MNFSSLIDKFAGRLSEKTAETTEEKVETSKQDLTESSKERMEEVEKPETDQELPERGGETGEDYTSLEGGFSISSTFGLAIPLEDQEIEDNTEPLENVESEPRHHGETIEVEGENEAEVEHQRVETEGMELGTAGIEETEVVKEGMLEEQDRVAPEHLPEEAELYPVEKTEIF
jgi:hypothetical protein